MKLLYSILILSEAVPLPITPPLVVIIITPLLPCVPYKEVDAASFSMLKDAMSSGLMVVGSIPITPSTTYKGPVPPVILALPRMFTLNPAFGSPPCLDTFTPAAFPCIPCIGSVILPLFSSSAVTCVTAPVLSLFFCVP